VLAGDEVDNFRLEELISSTPVASTFRAVDLHGIKPVFVKFPNPDVEIDPILSDRFKREEEIGSSLSHPGLLQVIDNGAHSRPYIVSEWFDGQLLRRLLNYQKKLSPERAVRITLNICDVLDYVEGHGVFHRDLRPENIMVGANDNVKLLNFGTAAMVGARRITFASMAQALGFSDYLAPEELAGRRGDARGDVYSLGVILCEMLMGRALFRCSIGLQRNSMHPLARLMKDPASAAELKANVSPQLQHVIYRALETSPGKRYSHAREMAHDLRNLGRLNMRDFSKRLVDRSAQTRKVLLYFGLALVPIVIFALLLFFAKH
jgi:serine/threonine-protein kinase